jgi:UDP-N-acetylenolpyruvoylglucosamine reductase
MLTADQKTKAVDALRARFADAIVVAGDADWDAARMAFNLVLDQQPEAVALPNSPAQTADIVAAAAELGLRVTVQGSSHNAGPLGSLEGTLLVRLERMKDVEIDADARIARVESGARWWDVVPQASELGLSALHGSSPEINVVGYSLGGGLGWQARKRGLQSNSITAVEVVTADGELRRVDADHDPDLFWALRGAGGSFGVVTAIEFRLYPAQTLYAGALFYPFEKGADVLHVWHELTRTAPEEITTSARLLQFPPLEDLPELVRGKSFAIVDGAFLGTEEDGAELLRPLRDLGPEIDSVGMVAPAALSEMHMDPIEPIPYLSAHALLGSLSRAAIDDAVAIAAGGPVPIFELRQTGGAVARTEPGHGAVASLPGEYLMFAATPVMDPTQVPEIEAGLARVEGAFAASDVGRYLNFTEQPADVATMFPGATLERLRRVKAQYDPDGVIRANHEIAASDA